MEFDKTKTDSIKVPTKECLLSLHIKEKEIVNNGNGDKSVAKAGDHQRTTRIVQLVSVDMSAALSSLIKNIDQIVTNQPWDQVHRELLSQLASPTCSPQDLLVCLQPYIYYDPHCFTRNLVWSTEKYDIILMGWGPAQASTIHNHSGSHCVMKVLEGSLEEVLYEVPSEDASAKQEKDLLVKRRTRLEPGMTAYIHDQIGWHRVINPKSDTSALSLHIYTPPIRTFQSYCEASQSVRERANVCFYSVNKQSPNIPDK